MTSPGPPPDTPLGAGDPAGPAGSRRPALPQTYDVTRAAPPLSLGVTPTSAELKYEDPADRAARQVLEKLKLEHALQMRARVITGALVTISVLGLAALAVIFIPSPDLAPLRPWAAGLLGSLAGAAGGVLGLQKLGGGEDKK